MHRKRKLKGNAGPLRSDEHIHATLLDEVEDEEVTPPIGSLPSVPLPPSFAADDDFGVSDSEPVVDGEEEWYDCLDCSDSELDQPTPAQPAKKTKKVTAPAFDSIRGGVHSFYLDYAEDVQKRLCEGPAAEAKCFRDALTDGSCCCRKPECRGAGEVVVADGATVYVITLTACHAIQLPLLGCTTCNQRYYPHPLQLACLPGNTNAYHLQRSDQPLLWFHLSLLEQLDSLQFHARLDGMYSITEALHDLWDRLQPWGTPAEAGQAAAGSSSLACSSAAAASGRPSKDTLRKQLTDALREYQYLDTHVKSLPEALSGWPLGPEEPCGACAGYRAQEGQMHTLHFDCCFKLVLLRWRGASLQYPKPANRRVFMDNADVQRFEESSAGYLEQGG